MKVNRLFRIFFILAIVSVNVGCDQISKSVVREGLAYHEQVPVFDQHLVLTKVENTGAFLSMGDALNPMAKLLLLTLLPSMALLGALLWLLSKQSADMGRATTFGLCCLIGGGIGNLFDRIVYGSVTDFLYFEYGLLRTGIFNLADVSITFGALLIIALRFWQSQVPDSQA